MAVSCGLGQHVIHCASCSFELARPLVPVGELRVSVYFLSLVQRRELQVGLRWSWGQELEAAVGWTLGRVPQVLIICIDDFVVSCSVAVLLLCALSEGHKLLASFPCATHLQAQTERG